MKQIYSAGSLPGTTASLLPSIRAASHGISPAEVQAALPYTGYAPPPIAADSLARALPVRLALLNTAASGRMLAHVAPNGGTYFAHALLNVPATADAHLAIQTWGSPHWQRHEPEGNGELPELPYLPVADVLDDEALKGWIENPVHRELLEFVLSALLATKPETRIFVAASADDVARIVFAVTRALPHSLLDNFTFSTYESEPLACQARLVGCDTRAAESELPAACFDGAEVAFNPATGRKSEFRAAVPFAAFAVEALADGNPALDEFRATWQRLGLADAQLFDLVYRLMRGIGSLSKEESASAVQNPSLATWISAHTDAVKQFLDWALDDREFAHHALSRVIVPLRQKADAVAKLAESVRQSGFAAIKAGDKNRAANALEVILPMAAPGKANAVWGEVLAQVADPAALSWEIRWYLLPRLIRFKHPAAPAASIDPALTKWLIVPSEQLAALLALDLPKPYYLAAARDCLVSEGEPSAVFARAVAHQPGLVVQLLQPVGEDGNPARVTETHAAQLFEKLIAETPDHPWFEDVLANAACFPAARRNRFFEAVLAAGKIDADRVIRSQGNALLELFAGQSGLDRLGRQFLAAPPTDVFTSPVILAFLAKLKDEPQIGEDVSSRIAAVQAVRGFLDKPEFYADTLKPLAAALTIEPPVLPTAAREQILDKASAELNRRADSEEIQRDLEIVLFHLGSALSDGPAGLYRELLRKQKQRRDFGRQRNTIHGFLAIALGATQIEDVGKQTEGLEAEAFAIATEAANRGGRRLLNDIDTRTKTWPKSARTQWGFLLEAVRPKSLTRTVRDLALFGAGALLASAVWFVVAQVTK